MVSIRTNTLLLVAGLLAAAAATAQPAVQPSRPLQESRGALLYSTHCTACHSAQVHWREKKLATDWVSLKAQVQRWQSNAGQRWSEEELTAVALHLNALYYHYEPREN